MAVGVRVASSVAVLAVVLILIFVGKEALPVFTSEEVRQEASVEKMFTPQQSFDGTKTEHRWEPVSEKPRYSVVPLLIGTLKSTIVALLIAIPLAVLSAVFVTEFAPVWLREIIKPCIELLAGIPSVIIGLLGLMIIGTVFQDLFGFTFRLNAVVAGVALSFAVIPIIFTITEDSLSAVPSSFREAALAMGANRVQTIWRVVLPVASPGIFAGIILGFGRAIGETMIVLMCSGNTPLALFDLSRPLRTMSATIASEMPEVHVGSPHYHVLFFVGVLLFVLTFLTNAVGQVFVDRVKRKLEG